MKNRIGNKGGRIALVSRDKYKVNALTLAELDRFEAHVWKVEVCKDIILTIVGVYRPPYSVRNGNMVTKFLDEFIPWMVDMIRNHTKIILMGDFNIHIGDEDDAEVMTFLDTIEALGLEQWVDKPTHRSDNILDLVVSGAEGKTKPVRCTTGGVITGHQTIHFTLELKQSIVMRKKEVTYYKLKKIYIDMFALDLADMDLKGNDLDSIISEFETNLTLDKHAQEVTKKITERKRQPWFDDNIKNLKRYMHRREKVWRRYKQLHQWRAFRDAQYTYNTALQAKKVESINKIIVENERDTKKLYKIFNNITGNVSENPLPDWESDEELANDFADFFIQKIQKTRDSLEHHPKYDPSKSPKGPGGAMMVHGSLRRWGEEDNKWNGK